MQRLTLKLLKMETSKIYGYVLPVSTNEEIELLQCIITRKQLVEELLFCDDLSDNLKSHYENEREALDTLLSKLNGCWKTPITDNTVLTYANNERSDKELIDFI